MVSVIMPLYNGERFLDAAVKSVQAQTVSDWELLIVDDCSTDGSLALAERLAKEDQRIRLLRNSQNNGAAASRMRGIQNSCGQFLAFLDCDDLWLPDKLEKQLPLLKNADVVYSSYQMIDENDTAISIYKTRNTVTFELMLEENPIGCSSVLLRRELFDYANFRGEFYHEDYVLWLELLQHGAVFRGTKKVLMKYRLRNGAKSSGKLKCATERWRIYRQFLKLPLRKSLRCFLRYGWNGFRKYSRKGGKNGDRSSGCDAGNSERH